MSDSIDRQDASPAATPRASLLPGEWGEGPRDGSAATQHMPFEGASSMLELTNAATDEDRLDSASEQNLRKLLKDVERLRKTGQTPGPKPVDIEYSYVDRFLERAREHFAKQDFKASLEILHDGLKLAPGNPDILAMAEEVRNASDRRQAELEESGLADRIAQCKAEAIELFEQGRYSDCIERFKVLSEIEPTNSDLRHYLEVSREQAERAQSSQVAALPAEQVSEPEQEVLPSKPQTLEPETVEAAGPKSLYVPVESTKDFIPELPTLRSTRFHQPSQEAELVPSASEPDSLSKDSSVQYPVAMQVQQLRLKAREEGRKPTPEPTDFDPDAPPDPSLAGAKKLKIAYLAGVGLVIGALLGTWLALAPLKRAKPNEEIVQSEVDPVGADTISPQPAPSLETEDPEARAKKAFQLGRLLEANRYCESILQETPDDPFALDLKQQIRGRYTKIARQAMAQQNWADASMAWHNLLKVIPGDADAQRQLKAAKANLKHEEELELARKLERENRVTELREQIRVAMKSGRHLPPTPGNAFELIQQLEALSSADPLAQEEREEIQKSLIASASRTLQASDAARAGVLVRQIETYFPEAAELKVLREGLRAEQNRITEARHSWIRKAEAAMTAGRFVIPASDSAVALCNQVLAADPQNVKALELKKTSIARAAMLAKSWIEEGKYDDARAVYVALQYLPQSDLPNPLTSSELKAEVEKLTFSAHAVVHDHALGSCSGRLRFNGYQLTYVPSTDSKDGFSAKLSEVTQVESDDKLKIQVKGKTYRFQINGAKDPQEVRSKISTIQQQISTLVAGNK